MYHTMIARHTDSHIHTPVHRNGIPFFLFFILTKITNAPLSFFFLISYCKQENKLFSLINFINWLIQTNNYHNNDMIFFYMCIYILVYIYIYIYTYIYIISHHEIIYRIQISKKMSSIIGSLNVFERYEIFTV